MHIVMVKQNKGARVDMRIPAKLKEDAEAVASMHYQNLTEFITYLLATEVDAVVKNNRSGFEDAKQMIAESKKQKKTKPRQVKRPKPKEEPRRVVARKQKTG